MNTTTWTETDALAPTGPSLAQLMLARGAQLAGPATAVAAQTEDVAVIEVGPVPAAAPCSHPSCAHASPHTPCVCYHCLGAGHGWITAQRAETARARFTAKVQRLHGGDVFGTIPGARDTDEPF
jgi:hypothetical protein